jgi:hypothetical protein
VQPDHVHLVLEVQLPIADRRLTPGNAVHHNLPRHPLRHLETLRERLPTHRLQYDVHAPAVRQPQYLFRDVGSPVVDHMIRANSPYNLMLVR